MVSSFTIVNAQMTTVTNLMTTSTTYVATSVSSWVMTESTEYSLYVGSFTVPANPSNPCGVLLAIGPFYLDPMSMDGWIISVVGTTDSPINLGPAAELDYRLVQSNNTWQAAAGCYRLEKYMVEVQGRFSKDWKINGLGADLQGEGNYYLVFLNSSPSAVNVDVHLYETSFALFPPTYTLIETSTVAMTNTVTMTGVAPRLIYLIKDNILLIVAVALLFLVPSALGMWRRTRRKKPESDTEETKMVTELEKPTEATPDKSKATMFCNKCGAPIPRESKFCKECGTNLS